MSDEFMAVATQEIREDVLGMSNIMKSCKTDSDVFDVAGEIEKHTHKLKDYLL